MSYDIYIGQVVIRAYPEDDDNRIKLVVEEMQHPDAPSFEGDEMTGKSNARHPGYHQWGEFTRRTGLHGLFFATDTGLMRDHPGIKLLRKQDLDFIRVCKEAYYKRYPHTTPGFGTYATDEDACLARLIWLEWWVDYALKNCSLPAIYNW